MERLRLKQSANKEVELKTNFYGASIVTASGEEVPITEQMLQNSFHLLIDAWEKARAKRKLPGNNLKLIDLD